MSRTCEARVLKALKSHTHSLSLDNSKLQIIPAAIGRLDFLIFLSAKNNSLRTLPKEIANLSSVRLKGAIITYNLEYLNAAKNS